MNSQMEETVNYQNAIAMILTAVMAALALIIITQLAWTMLATSYEERQARYHDKQARRHLAAIPRTTRDDRLLIAELANEHQKIADEWRKTCHATNGLHGPEQNYGPSTSSNAKKQTPHAGYAANQSTTKQKTPTPTPSKPTTTIHDQHTQN